MKQPQTERMVEWQADRHTANAWLVGLGMDWSCHHPVPTQGTTAPAICLHRAIMETYLLP